MVPYRSKFLSAARPGAALAICPLRNYPPRPFLKRLGVSCSVLLFAGLTACAEVAKPEPDVAPETVVSAEAEESADEPSEASASDPDGGAAEPSVSEPLTLVSDEPKTRVKGFVRFAEDTPRKKAGADLSALNLADIEELGDGKVTLNLVGAELTDVVQTILGDRLGENYVIDSNVKGSVTLQTSRPINKVQLLSTLREILRMNGAALVKSDDLYKVVLSSKLGETAPKLTFEEAVSRGLTIRIIPVVHSDVRAMSELLENFAPAAGSLTFDAERNLIFSVATAEEQKSIQEIVSVLDVDYLNGLAFALQPLDDASAGTVVDELNAITKRPGAEAANRGPLRFIAIDRMNAVLVIAKTNAHLDEALTWIGQLDQGVADKPQLFVYAVKKRRAGELANLIGQIFSAETIVQEPPSSLLAPGREELTLTSEQNGQGNGRRARASNAAVTQTNGYLQGAKGVDGTGSDIRIIADTLTNSLVVHSTPETYKFIKAALERLDVLPVQVLIEATLIEVSLKNDLELGVRWFFETGESELSFSDLSDGAIARTFPGFNYLLNTSDVRVVLSALRETTDVEFLSSPNMMVLDNQTARLQVGDEVPIQTRAAVTVVDPDAPIVNDIEYRETGVILNVTPGVTNDGLVVLQINQEVSEVVETVTSGIVSPTIQQRKFESTVAVGSGETVVLGGLTRNNLTRSRTGVPVLSSIPLLGNLFKGRSNRKDRTELIVLIKPRVIRDQRGAQAVTEEMKRKLSDVFERKAAKTLKASTRTAAD